MKTITIKILITLMAGFLGFYTGLHFSTSYDNNQIKNLNIDEIKNELLLKERQSIKTFVKGALFIEKRKKGSFFKRRTVNYLTGSIENKAVLASMKDIKIQINYLSKTNSVIDTQIITIYDYILPGKKKELEREINIPSDMYNFNWHTIDVSNSK